MADRLRAFIRESNHIEGIDRAPTVAEFVAHNSMLACETLAVDDVVGFVGAIAPGHVLRDEPGINVRVGDYIAPYGGPHIAESLAEILNDARTGDPYLIHQRYERLHPFTDGNGRSGRAVWLWMMTRSERGYARAMALGFLHTWYYQSLSTPAREAGR